MSEVWSAGTYERLAMRFAPVQDQLVERLQLSPGERVLDLATGTGETALRAARLGAAVSAIDIAAPMLEKARSAAAAEGLDIRFELGDVEYLPYEDACFDALVSNFGLVFAPDHANVASELARVACPGGRLAFTAWKPNRKLGELYRHFTEEPIEGREAYEWGRDDHVEDMLGDDFELEFEDGTLWLEAGSGEEIWELFSESAPPVLALLQRLSPERREEFHQAFVELYESYRVPAGGIRAPRRYLLVLGRRRAAPV
jgi:SAM-dependent methyltransferase